MSRNLRPRQRNAPSDHNYCFVPGLPVYDLRQTPRSYGVSASFAYRHQEPTGDKPVIEPREEGDKLNENRKPNVKKMQLRSGSQTNANHRKLPLSKSPGKRGSNKYVNSKKNGQKTRNAQKRPNEVQDHSESCTNRDATVLPGTSKGPFRFRKRSMCSACCSDLKRRKRRDLDQERRHSERLVVKNFKLPFQHLPVVVKLHIFKYLSPQNRGKVAVVCKEWASLLQSPRLWSRLDLACFDPPVQRVKHYPNMKPFQFRWFTTIQDYMLFKERMAKFFEYLAVVQPRLRSLTFQFDVGNEKDNWLGRICGLFDSCQCRDLTRLVVNWTETPVQPPCMETFCCLFNKVRLMLHIHFMRISKFRKFLEKISMDTPNLQSLEMPFEWSPRSVLMLSRFSHMRSLTLYRYVNLHNLSQDLLDAVLRAMPRLQYLSLEVVVLVYSSQQLYRIEHSELQTLDLSNCKGLFLCSLATPQLKVLKTSRYPWRGPLVARRTNHIPCLYDLLKRDAPLLTHVNKHKLHPYWLEFMYDELDFVLERVCPCKYHWTEYSANNPDGLA